MRVPPELYQMETTLTQRFPNLRPAQQRGLALWVYGTILAQSACQSAVITALLVLGAWDTIRQRLREWLYDGTDKAAPCQTQVEVAHCFGPLLRWLLDWWQTDYLALAVDATLHGDRVTALVVSVLYRGSAIPIAWCILPANQPGAWMSPILRLLRLLRPAMPPTMTVLVLADRGLWSPRLWKRIRDLGWHPLLRIQDTTTFTPAGHDRQSARSLIQPGQGWVGRGKLGRPKKRQLSVTLIAVWTTEQKEPWIVVSDLAPARVGVSWYALRMWVELGFRALKGVGWKWEHTRRRNPRRIGRYWLILAVATLWTLATGTRVEDARQVGVPPARLHTPPPSRTGRGARVASVFMLGLRRLQHQLGRGRIWTRLWLTCEPWPDPPPCVQLTVVLAPYHP
jgi:hypothetical protein